MVPESRDSKALLTEPLIPLRVVETFAVLRTVAFDDKPMLEANEIRNIGANRDLTTPFGRLQPAVSQEFHSAFSASVSAVRNARARALVPWESERWCGAIFDQ
jgi:hypothetical protein